MAYAGRQCTVIACVALCFLSYYSDRSWRSSDVDCIVREGHFRYVETVQNLQIAARNLQHNEIPRYFHNFFHSGDDYEVTVNERSRYGIVGQEGDDFSGSVSLSQGIQELFFNKKHEYACNIFRIYCSNIF